MSTPSKQIKKSRLCSHANAKDWGNYWPQGLVIEINDYLQSATPGQPQSLPLDRKLVLLHEYLHFLHNTTTLFGMESFLADWLALFSIAKANEQASKIRLPIKDQLGNVGTPESQSRSRLQNATYGDFFLNSFVDDIPASVINIEFDENHKILYQNRSHSSNFPVPSCTFVIQQGEQHLCYKFGALAVYESLAALLEDTLVEHFSQASVEPFPEFPYRALQYAAKYFEKRSGQAPIDRITLARIADRSLMTTAPGFFAVRYLEEHTAHPQQTVDETVKNVNSRYPFFKYEALISAALKDLKTLADALSVSPMKKEIFQWFMNHIETNLSARKDDPDKFIRPLLSNDPWGECDKLLSVVPIPIIQLNGYGYYTLNSKNIDNKNEENIASNAAPLFKQLQFVINLHVEHNQKVKCPAHNICTQPFKNADCLSKPWKHADIIPSCETGSAFAFLGVKGKKVKCYHRVL